MAFALTVGWAGGNAVVGWHAVQARGPGVFHAMLFAGAPFGKWQATVHVGGVVSVGQAKVPPAVVVPPANTYGLANPNVPPSVWHVLQAKVLRCLVWTSAPGQNRPVESSAAD